MIIQFELNKYLIIIFILLISTTDLKSLLFNKLFKYHYINKK